MRKFVSKEFGNYATIYHYLAFPYKGAPKKTDHYKLSCYAGYSNMDCYHVSVYETEQDAFNALLKMSCGEWEEEPRYVLMLNVPDVQMGGVFDTLEDAQDAGNIAIWDRKAIGYAVLNLHQHKVEVYECDFPMTGVFSDEVYANSGEWQTLTVHTKSKPRRAAKSGRKDGSS